MRGSARRHRLCLRRARARPRSRPTPTRSRRRSTTPITTRSSPRVDSPGYIPALAALVAEHDVKLIVPLTDLDQMLLAQSRDALAPALVLVPEPEVCRTMGDKYDGASLLRAARDREPAQLAAGRRAGRRALPAAREGARGLRLAPHLPRARSRPSSTSSSATRPSTRSCRSSARARSSRSTSSATSRARCLNAIPRTMIQSKGGESIKGASIKDAELIEHACRVAEAVGIVGPGQHPVLPRARRIASRHGCKSSVRRGFSAAARGGVVATRSSRWRWPTASDRSRGWATSAQGS